MKALFLILTLSAPVLAESATTEEIESFCTNYGELAGAAMKVRQDGHPFSVAYGAMTNDYGKTLVRDAYSQPRFGTKPFQQDAINDFRDSAHLACIKRFM